MIHTDVVSHGSTMDKRRIEVSTGTSGVGQSFIDMSFDKGQVINLHGYRASVAIEPQDADANANGFIAIFRLPGGLITNGDLPVTYGALGDEKKYGAYLWGVIPWTASNQTPFHWEFAPKTSRTIQAEGRILLQVQISGISAGVARINTIQTGFTSAVK